MYERMLQKTCVIRHRVEDENNFNEYGDPEIDTNDVETVCELQQVETDEPDLAGEFAKSTWNLFLPVGTAIDTTDQVIIDGFIYEITGEPEAQGATNNRWGFVEAELVRTGKVEDEGS